MLFSTIIIFIEATIATTASQQKLLYGVTYYPWRSTTKNCDELSEREITQDFIFLSSVAQNVQIFALYCNLTQSIVEMARAHKMGLLIGLSTDNEMEYQRQKSELRELLDKKAIDLSHVLAVAVGSTSTTMKRTMEKLAEIDFVTRNSQFPEIPVTTIIDSFDEIDYTLENIKYFKSVQVQSASTLWSEAPSLNFNLWAVDEIDPEKYFHQFVSSWYTGMVSNKIAPNEIYYTEFGYPLKCFKDTIDEPSNATNLWTSMTSEDSFTSSTWVTMKCYRSMLKALLRVACSNEPLLVIESASNQSESSSGDKTDNVRRKRDVIANMLNIGRPIRYFYHSAFDMPFEFPVDDQRSYFGLADFKTRKPKLAVIMAQKTQAKLENCPRKLTHKALQNENEETSPGGVIHWILIGVSLPLAVITVIIFRYRRRMKALKDQTRTSATEQGVNENKYTATFAAKFAHHDYVNAISQADYKRLSTLVGREWLIEEDALKLAEVIGKGHFGIVQRAAMHHSDEVVDVAVKKLHVGAKDVRKFLSEGILMEKLCHVNVLPLVGISFTSHHLPMIITPYMEKRDLLRYVKKMDNILTVRQALVFSLEIAYGMEYLHDLKLIHRDLAARNCMLSNTLAVKIADFGLCRDISDSKSYQAGYASDLPVRWMPPETLEKLEWTCKSDVWSYGVVLWELFSRGRQPYVRTPLIELRPFLRSGGRLRKPDACPDIMYNIMQSCWHIEAEQRPNFRQLCEKLPALFKKLKGEQILDFPGYYNFLNQGETVRE